MGEEMNDGIIGYLSGLGETDGVIGTLAGVDEIDGTVTMPDVVDAPQYAGPYMVIPRIARDIVLETRQMLMRDNVTVKEIPVTRTSNTYGGKTVVIG